LFCNTDVWLKGKIILLIVLPNGSIPFLFIVSIFIHLLIWCEVETFECVTVTMGSVLVTIRCVQETIGLCARDYWMCARDNWMYARDNWMWES